MGYSNVEFDGHSFDALDGVLELLLSLIVDEIDALATKPAWLDELREDWAIEAVATHRGVGTDVYLRLDHWVSEIDRLDIVVDLVEHALAKLDSHGAVLSPHVLNALNHDDGCTFMAALPTSMFTDVGRQLVDLLLRP